MLLNHRIHIDIQYRILMYVLFNPDIHTHHWVIPHLIYLASSPTDLSKIQLPGCHRNTHAATPAAPAPMLPAPCDHSGIDLYPLVLCHITIENGHRSS